MSRDPRAAESLPEDATAQETADFVIAQIRKPGRRIDLPGIEAGYIEPGGERFWFIYTGDPDDVPCEFRIRGTRYFGADPTAHLCIFIATRENVL